MDNRKGFKGFGKGLVCKGKKYAENTTFEEKGGNICGAGMMHYCVNPFNVLDHYPLIGIDGNINEFAEVEAIEAPVTDDGKKFATKKLHIGAKLDLKGFIKACFDFVYEIGETGETAASGHNSKLAASGDYSQLAASGGFSQLAASGDNSQLAASGDNSQLAASGHNSKLAASGDYSIAAGIGINNRAKAAAGSWIVLAEWKIEGRKWIPVCVKAGKIDGENLKADTWYKLEDEEFVELE